MISEFCMLNAIRYIFSLRFVFEDVGSDSYRVLFGYFCSYVCKGVNC